MSTINIAFDGRMILTHQTGIGRYTKNITESIIKTGFNHETYLIVNDLEITKNFDEKIIENLVIIKINANPFSLSEHWQLRKIIKKYNIDIFHSPFFSIPLLGECKKIITIHDLIHLKFPNQYSLIKRIYYKVLVKYMIKKSHYVVTVSENSKTDILKEFSISEDKVRVSYLGVENKFLEDLSEAQMKNAILKYQLPDKYFIYVGNNKPHKNLPLLIEAFFIFVQENQDFILICSTHVEGLDPQQQKMYQYLNSNGRIKNLSYIEDQDLPAVLGLAHCLVFPSMYEGFGLPPLEAMATGTSVITSCSSSLPEVVGDAGMLIDPYSKIELSEALLEISKRDKSQVVISKNKHQAKQFSWELTAEKLIKLYQ